MKENIGLAAAWTSFLTSIVGVSYWFGPMGLEPVKITGLMICVLASVIAALADRGSRLYFTGAALLSLVQTYFAIWNEVDFTRYEYVSTIAVVLSPLLPVLSGIGLRRAIVARRQEEASS